MNCRSPFGLILCRLSSQTHLTFLIIQIFKAGHTRPTPLISAQQSISNSMHFFTHSLPFPATCSNNPSLPRITLSNTESIPSLPLRASFDRCFFRETPHIRRIILSSLQLLHVFNLHCPGLPAIQRSLNFPKYYLIHYRSASSTPPPHLNMCE